MNSESNTDMRVATCQGITLPVDGEDCAKVAGYHQNGWVPVLQTWQFTFYETIRQLMLAGFCLLFFVGCASTPEFEVATVIPEQFTVTVEAFTAKQDDTLHALKENTEAIEKIVVKVQSLEGAILETRQAVGTAQLQLEASLVSKSETVQSGQSEDTSPDNNANDSQPVTRSVAESGDVPLFVYVMPFCQPCERLKSDWKDGKLNGFDVKFCVQTEAHAQQLIDSKIDRDRVIIYVGSGESRDKLIAKGVEPERIIVSTIDPKPYPAIAYQSADSETGWKFHSPHGYGPRILMELRATLLGEDTPVVREFPQAAQTELRSVDLVGLHNQLHGGGNWTWPGDLATHLQNFHGVMLNGAAQGYSGNQIISSRNVVRSVSRGPVNSWRSRSVSRAACPTCPR